MHDRILCILRADGQVERFGMLLQRIPRIGSSGGGLMNRLAAEMIAHAVTRDRRQPRSKTALVLLTPETTDAASD